MVQRVTPTRTEAPLAAPPPPAPAPAAGDGDTVVVACKIPNGLILRLYDMEDFNEPSPAGQRIVKKSVPRGAPVRLNGCGNPIKPIIDYPVEAGYGLTVVARDFWDTWLRQNQDSDLVRNRVIFASPKRDFTADRAREQAKEGVKSGLEPIDPRNPPKVGLPVERFGAERGRPRAS